MISNEIMQASLLDIIFENRNKDYGAYALRRTYNNRMLTALGIAFSVILIFILFSSLKQPAASSALSEKEEKGIVLKPYTIPAAPDKPKEAVKPKASPVKKAATVEYTSNIVIKPNPDVTKTITPVAEMEVKDIGDKTTGGEPSDGTVKENSGGPAHDGNKEIKTDKETIFISEEREPEFPGGTEALKRFLSTSLSTPDELDAGEKRLVKIRFKVDKDGSISLLEIAESGGSAFDKEVIRVCKKMPRWKPAVQNGINVSVSYILPVTFIGAEQ